MAGNVTTSLPAGAGPVGGTFTLPDANSVAPYVELFAKEGPYLAAILFFVAGLALAPALLKKDCGTHIRNICYGAFACAICFFIVGIFFWRQDTPFGPDGNIKYVVEREISDAANFLRVLEKVDAPADWHGTPYVVRADEENKFTVVMIFDKPPPDGAFLEFKIVTKRNGDKPMPFCRPRKLLEETKIVLNSENQFVLESFDSSHNRWEPLGCDGLR